MAHPKVEGDLMGYKTPVDRGDAPLSAYLLKILTIMVKRAGGEIRIDATDMMDESSGEGITKRYDRSTKQLVLSFLESGSEIFFNKGDEWPSQTDQLSLNSRSPRSLSDQRSSIAQPLRESDLMDRSTLSPERSASTLDDSRIADLEDHLRKE